MKATVPVELPRQRVESARVALRMRLPARCKRSRIGLSPFVCRGGCARVCDRADGPTAKYLRYRLVEFSYKEVEARGSKKKACYADAAGFSNPSKTIIAYRAGFLFSFSKLSSLVVSIS